MTMEVSPIGTATVPPEAAMLRELADRVAALEEQLAYPLMLATAPEVSEGEAAELRAGLDRLMQALGVRLLPPAPVLTPETARALLAECVTVVRPGEVLAVRMPDTWTARQGHEVQQRVNEIIAARELGMSVLLLPGEEFAVARSGIHESGNSA